MIKRLANPYLLLTLSVLSWSSNMVLGRAIRGDIPPLTLSFWRWVIAGLCVLPFALPHLRQQWPLLRQGWRPLLVLGLLGIGGYNAFAYLGLQHTTATNAALLNSFVPIATIAISWAFLGKHLKPLEAVGVLVSLCGALTIVARGNTMRSACLAGSAATDGQTRVRLWEDVAGCAGLRYARRCWPLAGRPAARRLPAAG